MDDKQIDDIKRELAKAAIAVTHEQYKPLVGALREAHDTLQTELNMSNYTDDEVHNLNNEAIAACLILRQALASLPEELKNV